MYRRLSHISILLLGLLSMSLVLSTTHSHEALQSQMEQNESSLPHAVQSNTNVCPICGYLFHAPLQMTPESGALIAETPLSDLFSPQRSGPEGVVRSGRSPPLPAA